MISKLLLVAMLLTTSLSATDSLPEDKKLHMIAGTIIYTSCLFVSLITKKNGVEWLDEDTCLIPVAIAAVGKEVYDNQDHGNPEVMDALATMSVPIGLNYTIKWAGF